MFSTSVFLKTQDSEGGVTYIWLLTLQCGLFAGEVNSALYGGNVRRTQYVVYVK